MGLLSAIGWARSGRSAAGAAVAGASIAAGLALAIASCTSEPVRFPHPRHVAKPAMGCGMCHDASKARATFPTAERCAMCHDGAAAKPEAAAFRPLAPEPAPAPFRDVVFDHGRHGKKGVGCTECHREVYASETGRPLFFPEMETCVACHRSRGVAAECATCHHALGPSSAPSDHRTLWTERHGPASRAVRARCESCHDEDRSCVRCHEHARPSDHTAGWKLRGHGLEAAADRMKCATCHRADQCARCHEREAPATHAAPSWKWGGHKTDARWNIRSCGVCHASGAGPSCGVCHAPPF